MATVWKDVWKPGTYRLRSGEVYTFTPRDVQNGFTHGKRMLEAGLNVPLTWEHDLEAVPVYLSNAGQGNPNWPAEFARNTFGRVIDYRIQNGALQALNEIPDDKDLEQWRKVRYCSPRLDRDYVDERGKHWPGLTISHIAATAKPVQRDQQPVGSLNLSQTKISSRESIFLGGYEMAEEDTGNKETKVDKETPVDADIKNLIAALREYGLSIPDEVMDMKGLCIAVKANSPADDLGALPEEPMPEEPMPGDAPAEDLQSAGGPPMIMSQTTTPKPMPPGMQASYKQGLNARLSRLVETGRLDRPRAMALQQKLKGVSLSMTDAGAVETDVEREIKVHEQTPAYTYWQKKHGKKPEGIQLSTVDRPELSSLDRVRETAINEAAADMEATVKRLTGAK